MDKHTFVTTAIRGSPLAVVFRYVKQFFYTFRWATTIFLSPLYWKKLDKFEHTKHFTGIGCENVAKIPFFLQYDC